MGTCECGCGLATRIAPCSDITKGWKRGVPLRFVFGHRKQKTLEERFNECVDKTNYCWLWTGYLNSTGYGSLSVNNYPKQAHRLSWELWQGKIPSGMAICHKCDVRHCVNPDHLFVGTQADNMRDCAEKGRAPGGCVRGEDAIHSKLTERDVRQIRRMAADGFTRREIAKKFSVSHTNINAVVNKKIWQHVT